MSACAWVPTLRSSRRWSPGGVSVVSWVGLILLLSGAAPAFAAGSSAPHSWEASAGARASGASFPPVTGAMAPSVPTTPHPGTIDAYLYEPAGADSVDPAVASLAVDEEPIINVYETLVVYNGSSTATVVPVAATCVPGTGQCTHDYGSGPGGLSGFTGIFNASGGVFTGTNGGPVYWTFVIDPAARFYDPAHGVGWPVYPSDAVLSIARTEAFSDPVGLTSGWAIAQTMLPSGNRLWDGGIHAPFNNTPYPVLSHLLVNDSRYCPASAMNGRTGNGCVTFVADANSTDWPELLDLLANGLGASIVPCGVFTANGAGLPRLPGSNAPNGDGPCPLPGGGNSTSDASYRAFLAGVANGTGGEYAWDALENASVLDWPAVQRFAQDHLVGSGPYFGSIDLETGYGLGPSPVYNQPSACSGAVHFAQYVGYCDPARGQFLGNVTVTFENRSGPILWASWNAPDWSDIRANHFSAILDLQSQGKIGLLTLPSLSEYQLSYALDWNSSVRAEMGFTGSDNIPANFFAWSAARGLLQAAYPYATIASNVWASEGLQRLLPLGGPLPSGLGCYHAPSTANGCANPYTVPWPYLAHNGTVERDPSVVGGATWWWAQGQDPASPYYDPQLANCTAVSPCEVSVENGGGEPDQDGMDWLWASALEAVTGGAVQLNLGGPSGFDRLALCSPARPGQDPCPIDYDGWTPSNADPADLEAAEGLPNGAYTGPDAVSEELSLPVFDNASGCGHALGTLENLTYWAGVGNSTAIPTACQGVAYGVYVWATQLADQRLASPYRLLLYDLGQTILNALDLYTWVGQQNTYATPAPWIDPATIDTNPMIGGENDQYWFQLRYQPACPCAATQFVESGLGKARLWTVSINGEAYSSSNRSLSIPLVRGGTYAYTIASASPLYAPKVPGGTVTVGATPGRVKVSFLPVDSLVTFLAHHLPPGTYWTVTAGWGWIDLANTTRALSVALPAGSYPFLATAPGFDTVSRTFSTAVAPHPTNLHVAFSRYNGYGVTFTPQHLPNEKWKVSLKLVRGTGYLRPKPSSETSSTNGTIRWTDLANGTYVYSVSARGYRAATGTFTINGTSVAVTVPFDPKGSNPAGSVASPGSGMRSGLVGSTATPSRGRQ